MGTERPAGRWARLARTAMAVGLVGAALAMPAMPASARYATGGSGTYKGSIDWFEWGDNGSAIPTAGLTQTNTRLIGGQTLATTCTIGGFSGAMAVATPGGFGGSAFDDLYNINGSGGANQLATGLSVSGQTVTFPLTCNATLDGTPVPLPGLVMADAEQSASNEYIEATIPGSASWKILDRFRSNGCPESTNAIVTGGTLRLANTGLCGVGPMAVAYMDGTTSATVSIKGGGVSIIALGVVLSSDFGDAPASYGAKGALLASPVQGGVVTEGTTAISGPDFTPATLGQPTPRLGSAVTSEGDPLFSATANADGADDSVAVSDTGPLNPGLTYTLPNISCTGEGASVGGWLDWNGNGTFDTVDAATPTTCSGGTASLSWTVPTGITAAPPSDPTFLRIAIGPDAASVASPIGIMRSGEVEDYAITIPNLPPTATVTGPADGATYFQGQPVPASYTCIDVDGTVASCVGTVPVGTNVDTGTPGTKAFTATATDDLGATGSSTVHYKVVPVIGLCKGQALGLPLNINVAVANGGETPCLTKDGSVLDYTSVIGIPGPLAILNNTITAQALLAHSQTGVGSAAGDATVARAVVNIPSLSLNLQVTGVASSAKSQLVSCAAPAVLTSSSKVASLKLNGLTIPVLDNVPVTIPLVVGALYINQNVTVGNTVIRRAVFLDLPGTALDVVIAESKAGAVCGS